MYVIQFNYQHARSAVARINEIEAALTASNLIGEA